MSKYLSNVKVSLFTLIMTFMLIGMIAVKGVTKKVQVPAVTTELEIWYYVNGDATLASSYQLESNKDCNTGYEVICQIVAPVDPMDDDIPFLSEEAEKDIKKALEKTKEPNNTVLSFRQR